MNYGIHIPGCPIGDKQYFPYNISIDLRFLSLSYHIILKTKTMTHFQYYPIGSTYNSLQCNKCKTQTSKRTTNTYIQYYRLLSLITNNNNSNNININNNNNNNTTIRNNSVPNLNKQNHRHTEPNTIYENRKSVSTKEKLKCI